MQQKLEKTIAWLAEREKVSKRRPKCRTTNSSELSAPPALPAPPPAPPLRVQTTRPGVAPAAQVNAITRVDTPCMPPFAEKNTGENFRKNNPLDQHFQWQRSWQIRSPPHSSPSSEDPPSEREVYPRITAPRANASARKFGLGYGFHDTPVGNGSSERFGQSTPQQFWWSAICSSSRVCREQQSPSGSQDPPGLLR